MQLTFDVDVEAPGVCLVLVVEDVIVTVVVLVVVGTIVVVLVVVEDGFDVDVVVAVLETALGATLPLAAIELIQDSCPG